MRLSTAARRIGRARTAVHLRAPATSVVPPSPVPPTEPPMPGTPRPDPEPLEPPYPAPEPEPV